MTSNQSNNYVLTSSLPLSISPSPSSTHSSISNSNHVTQTQFSCDLHLSTTSSTPTFTFNNNTNLITANSNNFSNSNSVQNISTFSSLLSGSLSSESSKHNNNIKIGVLHYVNGNFFKPIERLGDSQFIISQWPYNDIIVTVPCNIARYKPKDRVTKDISTRLNRVIGVCEQFLIFQIWKGNNEVEIFIYEYTNNLNNFNSFNQNLDTIKKLSTTNNNKIVRKLNRRFNSRTYTCLISSDHNFVLITPDYEDNHSYSHQSHAHPESTVILNINTFALLRSMPARCDQRFAFDPRYALPNYPAPRFAEFDTVRGQIIDLSVDKVIVCSNHTLKTKVFRVEYTRDGYLIIVVCTLPVFHRRVRRNYFIYILNSSTLLHMRSIIDYRGPLLSTYMFSNDFNLLFNMYPSLSNCASSIAILKNIEPSTNIRVIELYSLPNVCSMSLKELCRRTILRHVDIKHLHCLPLPQKMISYLSFNNNYNAKSKNLQNNNLINNNNNSNSSISNKNICYKCNLINSKLNLNKKSVPNVIYQVRNNNNTGHSYFR